MSRALIYDHVHGELVGRLTLLNQIQVGKARRRGWLCRCVCGTVLERAEASLNTAGLQSCGCGLRDILCERNQTLTTKHGESRTLLYRRWRQMLRRCTDTNFDKWDSYGGRGIRVCQRWMDFLNFKMDMGEPPTSTHTLDRKNNDGDYEPGNCRWATPKEQANNRRRRVR